MKRLLSILITNAWHGLRRTGTLPTAAIVALSLTALLLLSTVVAGAFPHIFPHQTSKHSAVIAKHQPITILGSTEHTLQPNVNHGNKNPKTGKSTHPKSQTNSDHDVPLSENTNANSNNGANAPAITASVTLNPLPCIPNNLGQPVLNRSATLNFASPLTSNITISNWSVNTTPNDESTKDLVTYITPTQILIPAGSTSFTLPAGDQTQPLPLISAIASNTYSYEFTVTTSSGIIDSDQIPVTQSTTCSPGQ